MRISRTIRIMSVMMITGMIVSACSSDTTSSTTGATTSTISSTTTGAQAQPSAADAEFCEGYATVNGMINSGPSEDQDPEAWVAEVTGDLETTKANAPESISSNVTRLVDALMVPLSTLDEDAFNEVTGSQEFKDDSAAIQVFLTDDCGFGSVDVIAVNYAYQGDLDGIKAGFNAVTLENEGTEVHEMILVRINDDTTENIQEILALPDDEAMTKVTDVGFAIAAPGDSSTVYADLEPGTYAFFCALPVGSTSFQTIEDADGPPHFSEGMFREFTVGG